jgi:hypothetical protein
MPEPVPKVVIIHPEAEAAIEMFFRVSTQWRCGASGAIGLDYNAIQWLFSMYTVDDPTAMLEDLQVMESAALAVLSRNN